MALSIHLHEEDSYRHHLMNIAPEVTKVENDRWVVIVDVVILALTILGSSSIIAGMMSNEIRGRAATVRMRLVQSLVMSDLVMGVVGIVGCASTLAGRPLVMDTSACDGLGVLFVAVMFTQHLWTLGLAFATFMILVHPLHLLTSWIEKYWVWSWGFVWTLAMGVAVIGHTVFGFEPSGGICFYGNNAGLYGELIQFIPRGVVFVCIALLYGKLYVFLKRPDKIRTGFSDSPAGSSSYSKMKNSWRFSRPRARVPFFRNRGQHTVLVDSRGNRVGIDTTGTQASYASHGSKDDAPDAEKSRSAPLVLENKQTKSQRSARGVASPDIPPWERIELPPFQVDGQRYGGAAATPTPVSSPPLWADWRGFGGRKRPTSAAATPVATNKVPESPVSSNPTSPVKPAFERSMSSGKMATPTSASFDGKTLASPTNTFFSNASTSPQLRPVKEEQTHRRAESESDVSSSPTAVDPSVGRRRSAELSFSLSSTAVASDEILNPVPIKWTPRDRIQNFDFSEYRRGSEPVAGTDPVYAPFARRPSMNPAMFNLPPEEEESRPVTPEPPKPAPAQHMADVEKAMAASEEEDGKWDLQRMLREAPSSGNDPFAVTATSDNVEYVPESMASYLNRKTALLMLWFPLGYVILFSVSLVRIIYDFTGQPPLALRAISRWMIFGQGLLDALIYGFVEWNTKRVVRKRVRKGTFSPHTSHTGGGGSGLGSHLRAIGNGWRSTSPNNSKVQPEKSQTAKASRIASPTVSFVDPEASILQRLDVVRKDSTPSSVE